MSPEDMPQWPCTECENEPLCDEKTSCTTRKLAIKLNELFRLVADYANYNDDKDWLRKRLLLGFKEYLMECDDGMILVKEDAL